MEGNGGEDLRVVSEEADGRGAQMGCYEANRGKPQVHDGVWVQTHSP